MIDAEDIRSAQAQLDKCRHLGIQIWFWQGEIHITGEKPSGRRVAQLRKYEQAIRQLLGDDGRSRTWAVSQLPGGSLLYQHPRFDTGDRKPTQEERPMAIMPFGKYRGAPLDAVRADNAYAEWLLRQTWFGERYPEHRRYLLEALTTTQTGAEGPNTA